jgi:hypothetical protein
MIDAGREHGRRSEKGAAEGEGILWAQICREDGGACGAGAIREAE